MPWLWIRHKGTKTRGEPRRRGIRQSKQRVRGKPAAEGGARHGHRAYPDAAVQEAQHGAGVHVSMSERRDPSVAGERLRFNAVWYKYGRPKTVSAPVACMS
jgi:hypothetical protein